MQKICDQSTDPAAKPALHHSVVVMGVSGCGKSSLAQALAESEGLPLCEGDDFHSAANRKKMAQGIALTDDDRWDWLDALGREIARHEQGCVLSCSALKAVYRERLRAAAPRLRFVFLDLSKEEALKRVTARAATHFFSATLVDSQFATLESPEDEPLVLCLDATQTRTALRRQVSVWLGLLE